jgi:hypothetical protein
MSADLAARLRTRGAQLAAQLARRARAALVQRWTAQGVAARTDDAGVTLSAPGLMRRRQGTRQRLPDPNILWHEE